MPDGVLAHVLDPRSSRWSARAFRTIQILAVGLGVTGLVIGTVPAVAARYGTALTGVVLLLAALFLVEYLARLRLAASETVGPADDDAQAEVPKRAAARALRPLRWALTPYALIDLTAALPVPIALIAGMSSGNARLLAALWVLKLARHTPAIGLFGRVVRNERRALVGVMVGFVMALVLAATLAYLAERGEQPETFGSIPGALWWAIATLTTTGYGDQVPATVSGRVLAGVVMICGIATFALWAGILATGFAQELRRQTFLETWDLVARVPLFSSLGPRTIADMTGLLRRFELGADQTVIRKGRPGDCMYFIVEGEVEVQIQPRSVMLGPGGFFGEMALITGEARKATVVTAKPTILLVLDVADFRAMAAARPEVMAIIHAEAERRGTSKASAS